MTVSDIVLRLVVLRLGALLLAGLTLHALQAQRSVVIPAATIGTTASSCCCATCRCTIEGGAGRSCW